jgi:hypothetical protein
MRTRTILVTAVLGLAACGPGGTKVEPGTAAGAGLPAAVVAAAEPAGAKSVTEVKATAKEGDEVVVRGQVGGSAKPVVDGRAVFTIADPEKLHSCNQKPGDTCGTPWDYCCHTPAEIAAATLSVQVVGADGRPVAADVGASGVKPLTMVVVKGRVGPRPDPKVLVIDAAQVFVAK